MRKKHFISSFSYPREKETVVDEAEKIARRENTTLSNLITSLLEGYVRTHSSGNPSFVLSKWIEQPEFVGDPAVREQNDKWDRYLDTCEDKDLQQLMGVFKMRYEQAAKSWKKKRYG